MAAADRRLSGAGLRRDEKHERPLPNPAGYSEHTVPAYERQVAFNFAIMQCHAVVQTVLREAWMALMNTLLLWVGNHATGEQALTQSERFQARPPNA